ncbi:MAG: polyprenyl diphosphate synthase, partial [Pseudomonadota bacterium]
MSEVEDNVPRHIAIIMDGNGRWAKKQGVPVSSGHKAGVEALGHIVKSCEKHQISVLTLFAFSRENWQRPEKEVSALMSLFSLYLNKEINNLHDNGVRVRFIGSRDNLADKLLKKMEHAEHLTRNNTALTVVMAVDYSGVWDLVQATKSITQAVLSGDVMVDDIDDALLTSHLSLSDIGAPDLCIRTSGE